MKWNYSYTVVTVFFLGWILIYADRTILYPLLPIIQSELNLTYSQVGLIASAYFVSYVAMAIPSGYMGDRIGRKKVLVPFFTFSGLTLGIIAIANNYFTMILATILYGLGAGAYYANQYALTMDSLPVKIRGKASAIINSGMSIGLALGMIGADEIYSLQKNWRHPFLVLTIPTILTGLLIWILIKEKSGKIITENMRKTSYPAMVKNRNLLALYTLIFCSLYGFWVVTTWLPTFLIREKGVSLALAGLISSIVAFSAIPAAIFWGGLSDEIGRKKIALALLPLATLAIFLMVLASELSTIFVVLVFYGLVGKLALDPVAVSWLADITDPETRGTSMSIFQFSGMSSAVVAPFISGLIADLTGSLATAFYLGSIVVSIGMVAALSVQTTQT